MFRGQIHPTTVISKRMCKSEHLHVQLPLRNRAGSRKFHVSGPWEVPEQPLSGTRSNEIEQREKDLLLSAGPRQIYCGTFLMCRKAEMQIPKRIAKLIAVAGLVLGFATCVSAQVTWTLSDVVFNNGNSVTGSFVTNSSLDVTSYSLVVSGPATQQAFTASIFVNDYLANQELGFASSGFSEYVDLYFASPLTNAGGTIPFVPGLYGVGFDCGGGGGCGTLLNGNGYTPELIGTTPEPATGGLLLLGFGMIMRKRISQRRRPATGTVQS